jgi:hypothetical protein
MTALFVVGDSDTPTTKRCHRSNTTPPSTNPTQRFTDVSNRAKFNHLGEIYKGYYSILELFCSAYGKLND